MKNIFEKAKNEYNAIDIPSELNAIVEDALNKEECWHHTKPSVYRYLSIAACICLCAVIGVGYFSASENDFDTDSSIPETYTTSIERSVDPGLTYDSAVEEASASKKNAKAVVRANGGEVTELYSDDNVYS